jgi:hypothetical protein
MFIIFISFIFFIILDELSFYDLKTFNILNFFTKRNAFATLNKKIHYPMVDVLSKHISKNKTINILEIGAGNGISTFNFINKLDEYKYNYTYTVNEYYSSYKNDLLKIVNEDYILMIPFEDIHNYTLKRFDVILLTAVSAINETNIIDLRKVINYDTKIVTICPYIFTHLLKKYFTVVEVVSCTNILGIFILFFL